MKRWALWVILLGSALVYASCGQSTSQQQSAVSTEQDLALEGTTPEGAAEGTAEIAAENTEAATTEGQDSQTYAAEQTTGDDQYASAIETQTEVSSQSSSTGFQKPTIANVQQALQNAGLYKGSIDGKLGPQTARAIEYFQASNKLKVDGKVGPKTWERLGGYLNTASTASQAAPVVE